MRAGDQAAADIGKVAFGAAIVGIGDADAVVGGHRGDSVADNMGEGGHVGGGAQDQAHAPVGEGLDVRCELDVVTYQDRCRFPGQGKAGVPVAGREKRAFAGAVKLDLAVGRQARAIGAEGGGGVVDAVAVAFGEACDQGRAILPGGLGKLAKRCAVQRERAGRDVGPVVAGQPDLGQDQGRGAHRGGGGQGLIGPGEGRVQIAHRRGGLQHGQAHGGSFRGR